MLVFLTDPWLVIKAESKRRVDRQEPRVVDAVRQSKRVDAASERVARLRRRFLISAGKSTI